MKCDFMHPTTNSIVYLNHDTNENSQFFVNKSIRNNSRSLERSVDNRNCLNSRWKLFPVHIVECKQSIH